MITRCVQAPYSLVTVGEFSGSDRPKPAKSSPRDYTEIAIRRSGLFGLQLDDLFMELWEQEFGTPTETDQG
ncbi:MAG TPA: hypothetical protein V6D27_14395 [Vampirovibrionales bacterium]